MVPYKYIGRLGYYKHETTPLLHLGARHYSPQVGRFWTQDLAKQGVNWYPYVANRATGAADPEGLLAVPRPLRAVWQALQCACCAVGWAKAADIGALLILRNLPHAKVAVAVIDCACNTMTFVGNAKVGWSSAAGLLSLLADCGASYIGSARDLGALARWIVSAGEGLADAGETLSFGGGVGGSACDFPCTRPGQPCWKLTHGKY